MANETAPAKDGLQEEERLQDAIEHLKELHLQASQTDPPRAAPDSLSLPALLTRAPLSSLSSFDTSAPCCRACLSH